MKKGAISAIVCSMTKKVLIIEDDSSIIQMYSLKFQEAGYAVVQATTGVEGLEVAKKEKPDVILLDVIIPQYDGFVVTEKLQADPATKNIPIILLTNLAQEGDKDRGIKLGAKDYLIKAEFTPTEVLAKVQAFLKK